MELLEKDVQALNLSYLTLCREYARLDKVLCAEKFSMERRIVDRIARCTMDELKILATGSSFLFQLRSSVAMDVLLAAVLAPGISNEQLDSLRQASLLADDRVREASA